MRERARELVCEAPSKASAAPVEEGTLEPLCPQQAAESYGPTSGLRAVACHLRARIEKASEDPEMEAVQASVTAGRRFAEVKVTTRGWNAA